TLTHDGTHRPAHEGELESTGHDRRIQKGTAHGDQCILLARLLLRGGQAILVLLAVAEFQAIDRLQIGADFLTAVGIEEDVETGTRVDTHVVLTLGTYV